MSSTTIKNECDAAGPCSFHADGGDKTEPCLTQCDVKGCGAAGIWWLEEGPGIEENPTALCSSHLLNLVRKHVLEGG